MTATAAYESIKRNSPNFCKYSWEGLGSIAIRTLLLNIENKQNGAVGDQSFWVDSNAAVSFIFLLAVHGGLKRELKKSVTD